MGFIYNEIFLEHDPGLGHPENPERLKAIIDTLKKNGHWEKLTHYSAEPITKKHVRLAHSKKLTRFNFAQKEKENIVLDEGDTRLSPKSIEAARTAAGAAILAVDLVLKKKHLKRVFVATRPPGHHAERNRSMGFCIFNNVAVAASYAIESGLAQKVLIVDWDVHHGNGTQDIFYERDDVYFLSIHQSPLYPFTGVKEEKGTGVGLNFTRNYPLKKGKGDAEYTRVINKALNKVATRFIPDLILISAGFDTHKDDPIGGMVMSSAGFNHLTESVNQFANTHCKGRIISFLEGGYNMNALAESVQTHLIALAR